MADPAPKVTLYWLEQSRAQRIVWLLEECKIEYDVKIYKRRKDKLAPKELEEIHPLGKAPVLKIEVPGKEPIVLAESGLMIEYLCEHFAPHLIPEKWQPGQENKVGGETETWMRYRYLMHFTEGSVMPNLVLRIITDTIRGAPIPFFIKPITNQVAKQIEGFVLPNIQRNFELLESYLATSPGGGKYITGTKLTGADLILGFPGVALNDQKDFDKKKFPKLSEYCETLKQEPGYKSSVAKIEKLTGQKFSARL